MYLNHYNLKVKPFEITSDPEFLWFGEKHNEAYAMLRYGVIENKGALLLTGDIGLGKTTLIAALVKELSDEIIHTIISDPGVTVMDFYRYLAHGFGLDTSFCSKAEFLRLFRTFLYKCHDKGKSVLLIIDEAQRMGQRVLEDVRLLSNVEKDGIKLMTVFFVGQKEFLETLAHPLARALRQRITVSYTIDPLELSETYRYIAARLRKAGAQANCFTKAAIEEIHLYSGGAPRMINVLCDMAMVVGYSKGVTRIEKQTVRDGARKLPGTVIPIKKSSRVNDRSSEPVPHERRVLPVTEKISEGFPAKRSSGYLFFLMVLALSVLFVIGMFWLQQVGGGALLHSSTPGKGAAVSLSPNDAGRPSLLMYPVTLYFARDSGVMAPQSVPLVRAVASSLKHDRGARIVVRGFVKAMANDFANFKESLSKANFVKNRLVAAGISMDRIRVFGMGSAEPQAHRDGPQVDKIRAYVEIDVVKE